MNFKKFSPWIALISIVMIIAPNFGQIITNPLTTRILTISGIVGLIGATILSGKLDTPYYRGLLFFMVAVLILNFLF